MKRSIWIAETVELGPYIARLQAKRRTTRGAPSEYAQGRNIPACRRTGPGKAHEEKRDRDIAITERVSENDT